MLEKPRRWKKLRRIFVQSMGDLFHPETPEHQIAEVIQTTIDCPQHVFIFLTKCPDRYRDFYFPANSLLGATATDQEGWDKAADAFLHDGWRMRHHDRIFISAEPLLAPIDDPGCFITDLSWLIIGPQSGPGSVLPRREWVVDLCKAALDASVPVFTKNNFFKNELINLTCPFPFIQQFPEETLV